MALMIALISFIVYVQAQEQFNNKVLFDIDIDKSEIGTSDIYLFYKGIAQNQKLNLKSHIKGTLNNLKFNDLLLKNNNNLLIDGKIII